MMGSWTPAQWLLFASLMAVGLAILGLVALAIGHVRAKRAESAEVAALIASWRATPSHTIAMVVGRTGAVAIEPANPDAAHDCNLHASYSHPIIDPTGEILAHVAPGPGSLTSLREVGPGTLTAVEPLIDPDVSAWFDAALGPVLDSFRVGIEPAMRKAKLWQLRGYAGQGAAPSARAELDHWRIDTPTGEWPIVTPAALADALLVAV